MSSDNSNAPTPTHTHSLRDRLDLKGELLLALLPTATILIVLFLLKAISDQRLLFSSLASSALFIYLDPNHGMNQVRTIAAAHLIAATLGLIAFALFGHSYAAAGAAMSITIGVMIVLNVVHPPAVSTSLIFAFRSGEEKTVLLFGLALVVVVLLVVLQRTVRWVLQWRERSG